jgi:hypothetical protein
MGRVQDASKFEESKHPRGQPENAGQFGSGQGGGEKSKPEKAASEKPKSHERLKERTGGAKVRRNEYQREQKTVTGPLSKQYSKNARLENGVVHTNNVFDATRALYEGRKVSLKQPEQVSTLVDHLGNVTKQMVKLGLQAPNFNLCNVSVKGTNLFCAESKGIPRIEMPQLDDEQTADFREQLRNEGHTIDKKEVRVDFLRATQNELIGAKVAKIAKRIIEHSERGDIDKRLVVSRDNYILDGHHHWAAQVALGIRKMKVSRVDIDIITLLDKANKFTGGKGKKAGDSALDSLVIDKAKFEESKHPRGQPENAGQFGSGGGGEKQQKPAGRLAERVGAVKQKLNPAQMKAHIAQVNQFVASKPATQVIVKVMKNHRVHHAAKEALVMGIGHMISHEVGLHGGMDPHIETFVEQVVHDFAHTARLTAVQAKRAMYGVVHGLSRIASGSVGQTIRGVLRMFGVATGDSKMAKAEARYIDGPVDTEPCKRCSMYRDLYCTAVVGEISPNGHCKLWESKGVQPAQDAPANQASESELRSTIKYPPDKATAGERVIDKSFARGGASKELKMPPQARRYNTSTRDPAHDAQLILDSFALLKHFRIAKDASFKESDHPRDNSGKFGSITGGAKEIVASLGKAEKAHHEHMSGKASKLDSLPKGHEIKYKDRTFKLNDIGGNKFWIPDKKWRGKSSFTSRQLYEELGHGLINQHIAKDELAFDYATLVRNAYGKYVKAERECLAFDYKSVRHYDHDGRLHVESSNISKAVINPYLGREIPDWDSLGLNPDKVYKLYRDPAELQQAAHTFNNLPLLSRHIAVTADDHPSELVIGSTGTDAEFVNPYLKNSLVVWPEDAIRDIESEDKKELSSAYRYRADMTPGEIQGEKYDGVMRDIVGNHVALVKEGRAGSDVVVGDSKENLMTTKKVRMSRQAAIAISVLSANLRPKLAKDAKLDLLPLLAGVTTANYRESKPAIIAGLKKQLKLHPAIIKQAGKPALAMDATIGEVAELLDMIEAHGVQGNNDPGVSPMQGQAVEQIGNPVAPAVEENMGGGGPPPGAGPPGEVDPNLGGALPMAGESPPMEGEGGGAAAEVESFLKDKLNEADLAHVLEMLGVGVEEAEPEPEPGEGEGGGEAPEPPVDKEEDEEKETGMDAEGGEEKLEELGAADNLEEDANSSRGTGTGEGSPGGGSGGAKDSEQKLPEMNDGGTGTKGATDKKGAKDTPPPFKGMPKVGGKMVTQDAMNAAIKAATDAITKKQRDIRDAEREVRPWVGDLAMAFDSADEVYKAALKIVGVENLDKIHPSAFPTLLKMHPRPGEKKSEVPQHAMDAASSEDFASRYPDAARIGLM